MQNKHKYFMYVMLMSFAEWGVYSWIFNLSVDTPIATAVAFMLTTFRYIMAFMFEAKSKLAEYMLYSIEMFAITTVLISVLFIPVYYAAVFAGAILTLMRLAVKYEPEKLKKII